MANAVGALWRFLSPSLARLVIIALAQIGELVLLAKLYFVVVPPSSLGILTVLSVAHTASISIALSLRSAIRESSDLPDPAVVANRYIVAVSYGMTALAFVLALALVLFTNSAFDSPPIYRALVLSWIFALPFEAALIMGLYTLNIRGVLLVSRVLWRLQIFQIFASCACIYVNAPLVLLCARLGALLLSIRILYPANSWRFRMALEVRTAPPAFRRLIARGVGAALMELAGKMLLFRVMVLDAEIALLGLLLQRFIHVASAFSLRTAYQLRHNFCRAAAYGSVRIRGRLASRFTILSLAGVAPATLLIPLVFVREELLAWLSPYGEEVTPAAAIVAGLVVIIALHATVIGGAWLVDEGQHAVRRSPGTGRRLGFTAFSLGIGSVMLAFAGSVVLRHAGQSWPLQEMYPLLLGEWTLILAILGIALVGLVRADWKPAWSREPLALLLREAARRAEALTLVKARSAPVSALNEYIRCIDTHYMWCRVGGRAVLTTHDPMKAASVERVAVLEISRFEVATPGELALQVFSAYSGWTRALPPASDDFVRRVMADVTAHRGDSLMKGDGYEIVPVGCLWRGESSSRRDDLLRYLDRMAWTGWIIPHHRAERRLKGIVHFNREETPRLLVAVTLEYRHAMPALVYRALLHNIEDATWPS